MSVVGLTFGNAANAIRPSAANAASVPTSATIRASGRDALVPGEARRQREREERERAELPAHARHLRPAVRTDRTRTRARPPRSGTSAPPGAAEDPRGLGGEVGAAGEDLGRRAVGDHARRRRAAPPGRRTRPRTRGRGWRRSRRRRSSRSSARELVLAPAVHAPRRLVEADDRAAARGSRVAEHDREREPLLLAAREVARMAVGERGSPSPTVASAAGEASSRTALVDQVVARVLEQQRDPSRAAGPCPRVGCISPAAWRSSVDLPAPLRPISATRSPAPTRQSRRPRRIAGPAIDLVPDPVEPGARVLRRAGAACAPAPLRGAGLDRRRRPGAARRARSAERARP